MKISRPFAILAFIGAILIFVGLPSTTALADSIPDPGFKLCCGGGSTALFSASDPNFSFTVNGGGGTGTINGLFASFDFINATGQTATGLNLDVTLLQNAPALTFICEDSNDPFFTSCNVVTVGTQTEIQFRNPNTGEFGFGGIPAATQLSEGCTPESPTDCSTTTPGADFSVEVFDVGGDLVNLDPSKGFSVQGTFLLPEPPTVLLLAAGVAFLFLVRRTRLIPNLNSKP